MRTTAVAVATAVLLLAGCAAAPQTDTSRLEELSASGEEMRQTAECLRDRGWPVVWEDGTIGIELPDEQRQAYEADTEECLIEAGVDTDAELTEEDYRAIYAWHIDIADCLEGAGWPALPRPSFEVFRETYETDPWIPWSVVEGPDYEKALRDCPVLDVQH